MPVITCPDCSHAADVPEGPGTLEAWCPRCRRLFEAPPAEVSIPTAIPLATLVPDEPATSPFDFGPPRPSAVDRDGEGRGRKLAPPDEVISRRKLTPGEARQARGQVIGLAVVALYADVVASIAGIAFSVLAMFVVAFVTFGACVPLIIPVIVLLVWVPVKQFQAIGVLQDGGPSRKITSACLITLGASAVFVVPSLLFLFVVLGNLDSQQAPALGVLVVGGLVLGLPLAFAGVVPLIALRQREMRDWLLFPEEEYHRERELDRELDRYWDGGRHRDRDRDRPRHRDRY